MATDLLRNILNRIDIAGKIGNFPDWYITELKGFKTRWSTDMLVDVSDSVSGKKKTESFKLVRVRHRTPDNRWITGGGCRHHPDVTLSQMESHALEMSFKDWTFGIPHGGSKGGCAVDPKRYSKEDMIAITTKETEEAMEAGVIGPYKDRWAPDIGTGENEMKWIQDQFSYEMRKRGTPEPASTVTGKPLLYGGMPGRKEATGRGLHYALRTFRKETAVNLPETPTAVLQGFGNVGFHFARLAEEFGIKIIDVQDIYGGVYHPNLPIKDLLAYVERNPQKSVFGFHEVCNGDAIQNPEELFSIEADIVIPAALEEAITAKIANTMKCKIVLEAANGPTHPDAELILEDKQICIAPDILVNAGGLIVSYFEWAFDTHIPPFDPLLDIPKYKDESLVFAALQGAITRNSKAVIDVRNHLNKKKMPLSYRLASMIYGMNRVLLFFATKRKKDF